MNRNLLDNDDSYVVTRDIFGRTVIRPVNPGLYLFLALVVILGCFIFFAILPVCLIIWGWRSRKPRSRLAAGVGTILIFLYQLFDISKGWFIPYFFGKLRFYPHFHFSGGHVFWNPAPFIILCILNTAAFAIGVLFVYRHFKQKDQPAVAAPEQKPAAEVQKTNTPGFRWLYKPKT